MENKHFTVSALPKTWILDLDGTIVKHNGYKLDGTDTMLPGAKDFLAGIPEEDMIIFITSRKKEVRRLTEDFLQKENVRYHHIIFDAPYGERILINDKKTSNLTMAIAVNVERDHFMTERFEIDDTL